ncbi:MAG TPA: SDR family oxidoreductase [Steroidobacteraceae bacterium]|nr:SDR family oxidoreductase [Steroidobacteraceae bacterium]
MSFIITGASGSLGRLVTWRLLERVPASEVILVTRKPHELAALARRGVTVRFGDFDRPESLPDAFAGGDRMLLISTLSVGRRSEQHIRAIRAAIAAGVRYIAYTSSGGMDARNPATVIRDHLATELMLRDSGSAYTILRDSLYIEAALYQIAPRALALGKWISSSGEGRVPFVAKDDCAACAVEVLLDEAHEGRTYEITGPELLSYREVAAIASEIDGRPLEYTPVSDEDMAAMLAGVGVPWDYTEGMYTKGVGTSSISDIVSYERGVREGFFAIESQDAKRILRREPLKLRDVFIAHREVLKNPAI